MKDERGFLKNDPGNFVVADGDHVAASLPLDVPNIDDTLQQEYWLKQILLTAEKSEAT